MVHRQADFVRLCRGLAHELSNVLTYLLPAIGELEEGQQLLLPALEQAQQGGPEALGRLAEALSPEDLRRLLRQLQLGGCRLQQLFRDLRLGFTGPPRERSRVALRAALVDAVAAAPEPVPLRLLAGPELWVAAEATLLGEALGRLVRAAAIWAKGAAAEVRLTLVQAGDRARIEALLLGDAAQLPSPDGLLDMLCPHESGAVRAERGPLGILVGAHLFRAHGGDLFVRREGAGVALCAEVPLWQEGVADDSR